MKKHIIDVINSMLFITVLSYSFYCKAQVNIDRTWSVYKADENSSNYSPLRQITVANVNQLKPAWTFSMQDMPASSQPGKSECMLRYLWQAPKRTHLVLLWLLDCHKL